VGNVNLLRRLVTSIDPGAGFDAAAAAAEAIQGLRSVFLGAMSRGHLVPGPPGEGEEEPKFVAFMRKVYAAFKRACLDVLRRGEEASMQVAALAAVMEAVRSEPLHAFQNELFVDALESILRSPGVSSELMGALSSKYLGHWDVRYYTCRGVARLAQALPGTVEAGESRDDIVRNTFDLLKQIPPCDKGDEVASWCGAWEAGLVSAAAAKDEGSRARRKRKEKEGAGDRPLQRAAVWANQLSQVKEFSAAWLAFLQMPLPNDIYKKVLVSVHAAVLPNLSNPLLLSDFLTKSLDQGGLVGMLALHGIFILVTQHGLEYPDFYKRLYGLLQPTVLQLASRGRFFKLADVFLSSPMVPAYSVAAFCKRFARLALSAPPHGAMICVAFVNNLLRRHPAITVLLHRPPRDMAAAEVLALPRPHDPEPSGALWGRPVPLTPGAGGDEFAHLGSGADPFLAGEDDPARTRAVESSLWELAALSRHASPHVSQFAHMILSKDHTDKKRAAESDLEPLLASDYGALYRSESTKKLKKSVPVAFYSTAPGKLHDRNCQADFAAFAF